MRVSRIQACLLAKNVISAVCSVIDLNLSYSRINTLQKGEKTYGPLGLLYLTMSLVFNAGIAQQPGFLQPVSSG